MTRRRKTRGTWGGWRPGAGRHKSPDSGVPHKSRPPIGQKRFCLLTFTVREDVPSLEDSRLRGELELSFPAANLPKGFVLLAWAMGSRQLWLLTEVASRRALQGGSRSLGSRFSRAINRVFDRSGPATADRYEMENFATRRAARHTFSVKSSAS